MSTRRRIRRCRIDVPAGTTYAYLFVDADFDESDPWWGSLFELLVELARAELYWEYDPVQDKFFSRPTLTDEQKSSLALFLKNAPANEIAHNRTLRRAARLTAEQFPGLDVMYFAAADAGGEIDMR